MTQTELRANLENIAADLTEMIPCLAAGPDRDESILCLRRVKAYLAETVIPDEALDVLNHY